MNERPRQFLPGVVGADVPVPDATPVNATPGNGPLAGQTQNFDLNLVNFDWVTWHDYEWENWIVVDALLNVAIGFLNIRGIWQPTTDYSAGESVFDPADITQLYLCVQTHTSSTDFEVDKPLYWQIRDNADAPVQSVFGRIGQIEAQEGDYSDFYYTEAEVDASQAAQDLLIQANATAIGQNSTDIANNAAAIAALQTDLGDNYYNKTEIDAQQQAQQDAWEQYTDDAIASIPPTDLSNYYTKSEIDSQQAIQDNGISNNALLIATNAGDIDALEIATANNALAISNLDSRVTALENAGGATVTIGDEFPDDAAVVNGDMHYKTTEVVGLYVYYDDGDSTQWVQTNGGTGELNVEGAQIRVQSFRMASLYTMPSGPDWWPIAQFTNETNGAGTAFCVSDGGTIRFTEAGTYKVTCMLRFLSGLLDGNRIDGMVGMYKNDAWDTESGSYGMPWYMRNYQDAGTNVLIRDAGATIEYIMNFAVDDTMYPVARYNREGGFIDPTQLSVNNLGSVINIQKVA